MSAPEATTTIHVPLEHGYFWGVRHMIAGDIYPMPSHIAAWRIAQNTLIFEVVKREPASNMWMTEWSPEQGDEAAARKVADEYFAAKMRVAQATNHTVRYPEMDMDDLDIVRQFIESRFPRSEGIVLTVYNHINEEFRSGHRCSVCGRTKKQNAAIGYDCATEC